MLPAPSLLRRFSAFALSSLVAAPLLTGCLGGHIRQLKTDKEMLQARVMQLSQDLGATQESLTTAKADAEAARAADAASKAEAEKLRTDLATLKARYDTTQLALQGASNSQARELAEQINNAIENEQRLRVENEQLLNRQGTLDSNIEALTREKDTLAEQLAAAQTQRDADTKLINEVRDTLDKQGASITALTTEKAALDTAIAAMRTQFEAEQKKSADLTARVDELVKAEAAAATAKSALEADLQTARSAQQAADQALAAAKSTTPVPLTKEQIDARREMALKPLRSAVTAGRARVMADATAVRIILFNETLFRPGTTQISQDGLKLLGQAMESVVALKPKALSVEGHSDNTPVRNMPYPDNWELASARANEVLRWLATKPGVPASAMSSVSYSDQRPIESNKTTEGRLANRRVELVLSF